MKPVSTASGSFSHLFLNLIMCLFWCSPYSSPLHCLHDALVLPILASVCRSVKCPKNSNCTGAARWCRYSEHKPFMTSRAACCRWPCFGRRVGLDDTQRSLPTLTILWFCDSVTTYSFLVGTQKVWERLICLDKLALKRLVTENN